MKTERRSHNFLAGLQESGILLAKAVPFPFSRGGVQSAPYSGKRIYIDGDWTILLIRAGLEVAPTGSSFIVDANKNGTTIFTTQSRRPTIAASAFTALNTSAIEVNTLTTGDYVSFDVDQVGSTIPGSDLSVVMWLQRSV